MKEHEIQHLIVSLPDKDRISREQLYQYFLKAEGEVTPSTLNWRIHELKVKNIIQEIGTGWYTFAVKPLYVAFDHRIKKIDKLLADRYQGTNHCTWNIDWLNEFTQHQLSRDTFIVEVEKDLIMSVKDTLMDNGFRDVLPWQWLRGTHISFIDAINPVFILPLISRAPLQQVFIESRRLVSCPTLEKILVDIYDDNRIFHFVQGAELKTIFEHALRRYAINWTTLYGYAKRRGKEPGLRAFLNNHFSDILTNDRDDQNTLF